jgi:Helix-turn-helix domain
MENAYDHISVCVGYKDVFGNEIPQEELIRIISKYPLSLWLDLFAKIEGFLLVKRPDIPDVQAYLSQAFFTSDILSKIKAQNAEPVMCFSFGQLNLLRKLAIAYGTDGKETELLISDITIVLLAAQDFHNDYDELIGGAEDFESFCKFVIRNGYLNNPTNFSTSFSRGYQMNMIQATEVVFRADKSFNDFFFENTKMTVGEAMALNFALSNPFLQSKEYAYFVERLRKARLDTGLTQAQVAKKLHRPQSHISNVETGQQRVDVIELKRFASIYKKDINYFI